MRKKLYRSNDSVICGVCAGIAEYFNISPWVVRTNLFSGRSRLQVSATISLLFRSCYI